MNEKIKFSLVAVASFGLGAASMAGYLAWTFSSVMKEMNQKPIQYRRHSKSEN
jgi:hypothetical protein